MHTGPVSILRLAYMGMHFACQHISARRYGYGGAGQHITVRFRIVGDVHVHVNWSEHFFLADANVVRQARQALQKTGIIQSGPGCALLTFKTIYLFGLMPPPAVRKGRTSIPLSARRWQVRLAFQLPRQPGCLLEPFELLGK
jgi:hypothetical protein